MINMDLKDADRIARYLSKEGFYTELRQDENNRHYVKVYGIKLGYEFQDV